MQTKGEYTPGPWSVHTEDDSSISRARSVYICTEQGWPDGQLARVNVQDGLGEREANARLIAAAPSLLEADQEALDTLEKLRADLAEENADLHAQRIAVIDLTIAQLRAAIAKAKGLPSCMTSTEQQRVEEIAGKLSGIARLAREQAAGPWTVEADAISALQLVADLADIVRTHLQGQAS